MKDFKGWYILSLEFGAYRKELRTCVMEIDGNGSRGIVGFRIVGKKNMLVRRNRCHWTHSLGQV